MFPNRHLLRRIKGDGLKVLTNEIVGGIPVWWIRRLWLTRVLGVRIGKGSSIHRNCRFESRGGVSLGDCSVVNRGSRLDGRGGIAIGSNVSISEGVLILTADHDLKSPHFEGREAAVVVDDYVFVGTSALLLPGVHLGRGSAVAAGSVVTRDVPPYSIVAGSPARVVGQRPQELKYSPSYTPFFA